MNTPLQFLVCSLLTFSWAFATRAAEPQQQPPAWRDALKLLDSSSEADVVAAAHLLFESVQQGRVPPEAFCTLALLQLRRDKPAEALATIGNLSAKFEPAALARTAALALRIQLYAALATEDGPQADRAFKDLVRQIVAEDGDVTDLRYSAITIGVTVAMLEFDLAESPIARRDLKIGRECMLQSKLHGVASAFTSAYQQASERAAGLARQFQVIDAQGIEAVAAENAAGLKALDTSLAELAEQKELATEVFRNAREQTEQNTRDRRKLDKLIASLGAQLRQPTPGHPGPQRPAPPPPPPATSILVNQFELRTVYEYVTQNGQVVGVPVTREVPRSQADIDYERDIKYQRVMNDYGRVKASYDRYLSTYNQALQNWNEADRARRQDLDDQKAQAEAQRTQLLAEDDRVKAEKSAAAHGVVSTRSARKQQEFELELQSIALAAARAQRISSAFRPRNFAVISWSQEKTLLQRSKE